MRHLLGAAAATAVVIFAGQLPTYAATSAPPDEAGPVVQNSRAMAAADQIGPTTSIRRQIQDQLTKAGYTDITLMPSSFLVRATDKAGNPVEMVIGPDSVTAVTEIAPKAADAGHALPKTQGAATMPASKS